jgi:hypothetical protein
MYSKKYNKDIDSIMAICDSGFGSKLVAQEIVVTVSENHPLIILANALPWEKMLQLIEHDLKQTTPLKRGLYGRKLKVRIHLGAYLLQKMHDLTDRAIEAAIRDNAAYQVFCGFGIVEKWHVPDHTKIAAFRSRLSADTQHQLANLMCKNAVDNGLAEAHDIDIDSTVQEANMTYPTDAKNLRKLGTIALNVAKCLKERLPNGGAGFNLDVDIKSIASKARACFFLPKKATKEDKAKCLSALLALVSSPVCDVIHACKQMKQSIKDQLPWYVKRYMQQLEYATSYFASVKEYIETGTASIEKRLSLHVSEVACFNKKKAHKKYEFGRTFQIGRLSIGNFLFVGKSNNVRMDDKKSLTPMLEEHAHLFGEDVLQSVATDKGYYSNKNVQALANKNIEQIGIQVPGNTKNKNINLSEEELTHLSNRRAGIEPLIGHAKQGGQLGRSRMKNDQNTEAAGYAAILGFNLRQTVRALLDKLKSECRVKTPCGAAAF